MEWLRDWLLGVTAAALIATLADALCPKGYSQRLNRTAGGLLLLLAILAPIGRLDSVRIADALAKYRLGREDAVAAMAADSQDLRKAIIARESAAYISDKATALGIQEVQVWVTCRMTLEGYPAPETVRVRGAGSDSAWTALSRAITADFALEPSAQTLERMDVP